MGFSLWNWKDRFWEDEVFSRKLKHNRFKIFCDSSSTWNTGAAESLWIGKVKKPCLVANNPIMPPSSKKSGFNEIAKGTDVILRTQFSPWTWSTVYRKIGLDFFNCIQSCFSLSQKKAWMKWFNHWKIALLLQCKLDHHHHFLVQIGSSTVTYPSIFPWSCSCTILIWQSYFNQ